MTNDVGAEDRENGGPFVSNHLRDMLGVYIIHTLTTAQKSLLSQVCRVIKLVLVMPTTNATSERSFSALCRVKSYLRNTMSQQRLNNLMLLQVHKGITDAINLKAIASEFIGDSEHRLMIFGKFQ